MMDINSRSIRFKRYTITTMHDTGSTVRTLPTTVFPLGRSQHDATSEAPPVWIGNRDKPSSGDSTLESSIVLCDAGPQILEERREAHVHDHMPLAEP